MRMYYKLDDTGHIAVTTGTAYEPMESFDFPADFDFAQQSYYRIADGVLTEDTEKREAEEQRRSEEERSAAQMEAQLLYTALMTDTLLEE